MAKMKAMCSKCEKQFKHAASIEKYHGWCGGTAVMLDGSPEPKQDDTVALLIAAETAGMEAAKACTPEPMHVVERASPLDDTSPIVKRYAPVMGGVCGFAWISMRGNTRIANAAKKRYADRSHDLYFGNGYPTGKQISVMGFGQSMETKEAYARAYAAVLRDAGHDHVYSGSRMD